MVDFEATCCNNDEFPRDEMEIIEIGYALVDLKSNELLSNSGVFVRPLIHTELTDFCTELTGIDQDMVSFAGTLDLSLNLMMMNLEQWKVNKYNTIWGSWGYFDKNILRNNCNMHNFKNPLKDFKHTNLKNVFAENQFCKPRGY